MSDTTTKEKLGNLAESAAARHPAHAQIWELARQQGVKPIQDIRQLAGDFWPQSESADEFLSWLQRTRREDELRRLPE